MTERLNEREMLSLCGSAIAKIDRRGRRGTEMVTLAEIEALAAYVECSGGGLLCQKAYLAAASVGQDQARMAMGGAA